MNYNRILYYDKETYEKLLAWELKYRGTDLGQKLSALLKVTKHVPCEDNHR